MQALKLQTSLHSSDSGSFISPRWEDLQRSLHALGDEDELSFLQVMLKELNSNLALQLDTSPNTDLSSQPVTGHPDDNHLGIVPAAGVVTLCDSFVTWSQLTWGWLTTRSLASRSW
jgi:hypothetical protein